MIKIYYCEAWNYYPRAASLAEMIQLMCDLPIEIIPGEKGEFTVWFNNEIIAQKKLTFPSFPAIVEEIKRRLSWEYNES